jgi:hypothetical protein
LGTLLLAVQWADLLWPVLLLLGIGHVRVVPGLMKASALELYDYPWSHSLVALMAWGTLFGAVHWRARRDARAAFVIGACVVSHWFLDVAMHRPDMPVLARGPYVGVGLWNSIPGTLAVEGLLYAIGITLYAAKTRAKDRTGMWSLWFLLGLLTALWLGALFGTPPPNDRVLAIGGLAGWLVVPWGYWIDRHRVARSDESLWARRLLDRRRG